jgi:dienelactone hydrolase
MGGTELQKLFEQPIMMKAQRFILPTVIFLACCLSGLSQPMPPIITAQPTHRAVEVGLSATLSVTATGTAPLSYQWRFNHGDLPGKTTPNLVLLSVQLTNTGDYTVVITNLAGAVTSQVARLVFPGLHGLSGITALEDGSILLSLTGGVASRFWPYFDLYPVEASTNLMAWTPLVWLLRTNQPPNDLLYVDLEARALDQGFYRTFTNHLITPELPPTGPHAVGITSRLVTDPSRTNRYGIATNSSFMMSVWYPAARIAGVQPAARFDRPIAERCDFWTSQFVAMGCTFTNVAPHLFAYALPEMVVAANGRPFPVILYSHGGTLLRADNIDKAQELASHGFVVVAPDHVDAFMTVLPGGTTAFGGVTVNQIFSNLGFYFNSRLQDLDVVLNELASLNQTDPLLSGTMDLANVGALGWSLGGGTAAEICRTNAQVKAAVLFDALLDGLTNLNQFGLQEPFLTMTTTTLPSNWQDNLALYNLSTNHPVYLEIQGSDHFTFSFLAWLRSPTLASRRAALAINSCTTSFFKRYLKSEDDGFLNVATNLYPEIVNFRTK